MKSTKIFILESDESISEILKDTIKRLFTKIKIYHCTVTNDFIKEIEESKAGIVFYAAADPSLEIIQKIRKATFCLPLVVFSHSNDYKIAVKCIKAGATDYITNSDIKKLGDILRDNQKEALSKDELFYRDNNNPFIYKALYDEAVDAIFFGDLDGKIVDANSSASKLSGFSEHEICKMHLSELFTKEQNRLLPLDFVALKRGESVLNERLLFTKNGDFIPVEMNSQQLNCKAFLCVMRDISKRKKIEEEILHYQERLKYIVEHSSNLFFSHDVDGAISYASLQSELFFKCTPEELIKNQKKYYPDTEINKKAREFTKKALETGESQQPFEVELFDANGEKKWAEVHETPVIKHGKVAGIVGALVDITEWKKASEKLIASEQKFRKLFEDAPNGIILIDKKGYILDSNSAFCELADVSKEEIVGSYVFRFSRESDNIDFDSFDMRNFTGSLVKETILVNSKGEEIPIGRSTSLLFDDNGNYIGAIIHVHDIRMQKKAELEIKTREEQLTTLINASPDLICFKDGEGKWQLCNDANISYFQIEDVDYYQKTSAEMAQAVPKLKPLFEECMVTDEKTWKRKDLYIGEQVIASDEGDKWINVIKVPLYYSDGSRKAMIVLGRDITMSKNMELRLRNSQKMEAIGLMAAGIAHSFNNIIQAIVGYIDFAKSGLDEESQRYKDINEIKNLVGKATYLTKELLAVGRERYLDKNEIIIDDIISPLIGILMYSSKNIEVKYEENLNLPPILVDGSQIDQVILNILFNAKDAMPDGGIVKIKTFVTTLSKEFCDINSWASPGKYVCVSISDSGTGMSNEVIDRIFEPYFTTKPVDKGSGLGLSTAFGIISQHTASLMLLAK